MTTNTDKVAAWRKANPRSRVTVEVLLEVLETPVLHGVDLSEVDLGKADLRKADLRGTRLLGANLRGAKLKDAHMWWANLGRANLSGANLSGAYLFEADLRGADLTRADLRSTDLTRANLFNANLSKADLTGAYLREADLTGANLSGADFSAARTPRTPILTFNDLPSGLASLWPTSDGWQARVGCWTGTLDALRASAERSKYSADPEGSGLLRWCSMVEEHVELWGPDPIWVLPEEENS